MMIWADAYALAQERANVTCAMPATRSDAPRSRRDLDVISAMCLRCRGRQGVYQNERVVAARGLSGGDSVG